MKKSHAGAIYRNLRRGVIWFGLYFPSTSVSERQNQLFSARKFLSENLKKKNNTMTYSYTSANQHMLHAAIC